MGKSEVVDVWYEERTDSRLLPTNAEECIANRWNAASSLASLQLSFTMFAPS